MKKLTIITINYNNASGLKKTLDSVAAQSCMDFEHVIVDGASTDDSQQIIQDYQLVAKCDIKALSEPDTGIYNAMNKGIRIATGEYLLFLNSGDALDNSNVVRNFLNTDVTADVATGTERMPNGRLIPAPKDGDLSYAFFYEDTLLHQSTFIRRDAFERFGMYREDYRIVSDWEWFFRAIVRDGASYQPLDFVVADFDGDGMSNDSKHWALQDKEREQVHKEILPRIRKDYKELLQLRKVVTEYQHLREGRFGTIVNLLLKIKSRRK